MPRARMMPTRLHEHAMAQEMMLDGRTGRGRERRARPRHAGADRPAGGGAGTRAGF